MPEYWNNIEAFEFSNICEHPSEKLQLNHYLLKMVFQYAGISCLYFNTFLLPTYINVPS